MDRATTITARHTVRETNRIDPGCDATRWLCPSWGLVGQPPCPLICRPVSTFPLSPSCYCSCYNSDGPTLVFHLAGGKADLMTDAFGNQPVQYAHGSICIVITTKTFHLHLDPHCRFGVIFMILFCII